MSWSSAFLDKLSKGVMRPQLLLVALEDTGFEPVGATLRLSSHFMPGFNAAIGIDGAKVAAAQVSIGDWSASVSELTIGYRGRVDVRGFIARGQLAVLKVGFAGWREADFEPVFYGHVQAIDRSGENWTLTLRSVIASLVSRLATDASTAPLFSALVDSAAEQLTATYNPASVVLAVTDTSAAERETGGSYLLQMFPDTGDPFFLTATGKVAGGFTGVSLTGILGTAAVCTAGNEVRFCAYIDEDPCDAARKVMASTGTGANGLYDKLPATWGVGVPQWVFDHDDIDLTALIVKPNGPNMEWDVYSTELQDDGLSWLQGVLSPAGLVLVERQGMVTIRAVSPSYDRPYGFETVNDTEIVSFDRHQVWDSGMPVEFAYVLVKAASSVVGTASPLEIMDSRPASAKRNIFLDYVHSNTADWEDTVADRLAPWATRLPEIVEITCAGMRLAILAPCDSLVIRSRHFTVRDRTPEPSFMVLCVEPDWWAGTVRIIAAYIPESQSEF